MNQLTRTDKIGYLFLIFVFILSLYFGFTNPDYFNNNFAVEDGAVEYGTAFMLLSISILCLYRLFLLGGSKPALWKIGVLFFAILFFFGAGEEVSWGQRIFGIESSDFFLENNAQKETNLHNLVVSGKKVNKIVFSQLLMLAMVTYLLIVPFLYRKKEWVKNITKKFAVPVVKWHHTIAFISSTILVTLIPASRKWEVYELAFGVIFLLIFLNPLNNILFKRS
ncbi:hypothetical protein SAMN04487906_0593 [Zhouia amylolytica]|uniref:Uncharacterized protein n=1 Tax=Zhouia amylolytica TaxID=376730 RepID=A0A1I6QCY1_9FLAO|nr:hypothetical protein [Zhouia amylolytica]MCQ0111330.1 hypothetical protein [Zhouia amylolytica]SFS50329.1 hypothetical protein SAMN04487906_0593 [Zhouia amylolytica]